MLTRQDRREVLPLCAERQVAYLAFSPLAGGWLTGMAPVGEALAPPLTGMELAEIERVIDGVIA